MRDGEGTVVGQWLMSSPPRHSKRAFMAELAVLLGKPKEAVTLGDVAAITTEKYYELLDQYFGTGRQEQNETDE